MFDFKQLMKPNYILIAIGLIFFAVIPHLSIFWRVEFCIIFVLLGGYFGKLKGGIISALWAIFILNLWGSSLAEYNYFALLGQGVIFGGLFKYQNHLRDNLKKEKEMLDKILSTAANGIFVLDNQGDFIETNEAYRQMIGYSEEELSEMNIKDINLINDLEKIKNYIKKVKKEGQDQFESQHYAKNGDKIDFEISTTYLADVKDGILVAFANNITARKEKEAKLKASEAKFRSYINHAPYGVFVINKHGEYIEVNPKSIELIGYPKEEILGSKIGSFNDIVNSKEVVEAFDKLVKNGEVSCEFLFSRKGNTEVNVKVDAVKINDNRYIGFSQDITERKKIEKKIKKERDKLKKYFETTEAIVLRLDKTGQVKEINQSGCEILEYQKSEIIGKNWFDNFIKEQKIEETKRMFKEMIENKKLIDRENKVITKLNQTRDIFWRNNLLTNDQGRVIGSLSTGMDITEVNSLREELEYSRLQMRFFANLSHELKTPLNLIFSAQQMIELEQQKLKKENREMINKYLNIISQNGNRLLRLVNNLLDINKFEADAFNLNLGNYDVVQIVENTSYSVADYIEQKDRNFRFNSQFKSKVIACDPFNLERVLLNLLSNAIKFTEQGDKIDVEIIGLKDKVRIIISDKGIGITKEKQKQIFKRFRQADESFKRSAEGTGIGLSIVKLIIELHDGEIKVESTYGKGSKFIIDLPDKKLAEETKQLSEYNYNSQQLIDRINVELSDIYQ